MAEVPPIPREDWIPALSKAGWDLVQDRIVRGLCHDLSGRGSSLGGLSFLLESEPADLGPVVSHMGEELEHLERSLALLRLLPDDSTGEELLAPTELIREILELVSTQRGLENVEFTVESASDAPAIRIDPTFFRRSMILLLTGAAEAALLTGDRQVLVRATKDEGRLLLEVTPGFPKGEEPEVDPGILPKRIVPKARIEVLLEVLQGKGIRAEGIGAGEETGRLRLYFSPPSSA